MKLPDDVFCVSDDPEAAAAGRGEAEAAGGERSDGGESLERGSRYRPKEHPDLLGSA